MNKLQPIPSGEQATLKTEIEGEGIGQDAIDDIGISLEGRLVKCTFTVKANGDKGTPRYNLTQVFDFTGVTITELLKLAVRPLRIDVQAMWRGAKDAMDADVWQDRVWQVRAMLDQTRQKADPVSKGAKDAAKMTPAERKEHMKTLTAMIEADKEDTVTDGPLMVGDGYSGAPKKE